MRLLSSDASGLRHLRWGREILAGIEAFLAHATRLSADDREALTREAATLGARVTKLSGAVKPYRDFLERERVHFRARRRVADFLYQEAEQSRARAEIDAARASAEVHAEAYIKMEEQRRRPLKAAVRAAVADLREGLAQMNERLADRFGEALVGALYPELTRSRLMVADEDDNDDDASGPAGI